MMCAATGSKYGDQWGIVAATGCNTVYTSTYPYNPYLVPWTNSLFENAPADAMGVRARWDQMGWQDKPLWCIGGDGAMFDIGFQSLSRHARLGHEHQGVRARHAGLLQHRRPGLDQHLHGPEHQDERPRQGDRRQAGAPQGDRPDRHDAPADVTWPRRPAPTSTTSTSRCSAPWSSTARRSSCCYTTCQPEHGVADNMAGDQARLAVDTRAFPLLIYDPAQGRQDQGAAVAAGQPGGEGRLVQEPQDRRGGRLHRLRPQRRPVRQALRQATATRRRRCWPPAKIAWKTGTCCRSWRAAVTQCRVVVDGYPAGGAGVIALEHASTMLITMSANPRTLISASTVHVHVVSRISAWRPTDTAITELPHDDANRNRDATIVDRGQESGCSSNSIEAKIPSWPGQISLVI